MAIWARVQDIKAKRDERLNAEQIKDLELAASFVRSIETGDVRTDVEISEVAARLHRTVHMVQELARQRRRLGQLSDHMLQDIGVSRADALREADRPFWDGAGETWRG